MKKAFAYLRVSDPSQIKGDGFTRQLKAIKDYASLNKTEIVQVFKEQGVSGTKEHRPTLASLMVSLKNNGHGVTTVIIEKLDRLARDLMIQEAIIRDFQTNKFQLISTMEGSDLLDDDATRKLIRQVFGAIAEYDKTMTVAKLRAARERIKAQTGKCEGKKAYYETPEGQAVVKHIQILRRRTKYGKQKTWQQVADQLNDEGIKTMDGREWSLHRVQQIIQSTQSIKKRAVTYQRTKP